MGGGRIATLQDPSVVSANPASLTDLEGTNFQFNFQAWNGKTSFSQLGTGLTDSMIVPWKYSGSLYLTHQFSDNVSVGFGANVPFGVSINWPRHGRFRYAVPYDTVLKTVALNPAVGIRISDRVSIGLGLDIYLSRLQLDQAFSWARVAMIPLPDADMNFEGDGVGLGAYVGFNFDLDERQRLSIIGRLPVKVDYEGTFEISNIPPPFVGLFSESSRFTSEIEHPGSIGIGYRIEITDRTTAGLDFEWIQNSTHDNIPLDIGPKSGFARWGNIKGFELG